MGGSKKPQITSGLTLKQQAAENALYRTIMAKYGTGRGQVANPAYTGSFDLMSSLNLDPNAAMKALSGNINGPWGYGLGDMLTEMIGTGAPTDVTGLFESMAKTADYGIGDQVREMIAKSSRAGGTPGTPGMAAAAFAAKRGEAEKETGLKQLLFQAQESATGRRLSAGNMLAQLIPQMQALNLDANKLMLAAKSAEVTLDYEEWKRQNPDVYQLLFSLYGRNVDFLVQQQPDRLGPMLTMIGTVAGAFLGNPALGAMLGSAAAAKT